MTSKLSMVAAVSRPDRIAGAVANFQRQTTPAHLVLVLNARAQHAEVPAGDWTVLRCEGGTPARPRNLGLEWVAQNLGGIVAFWDDDDYYGPGYLAEVRAALDGHPRRVVGKVVRFAEFDDGVWLFAGKQGPAFLGGTMAGWAEELPPIPDLPRDEDHEWCKQLVVEGFELHPTSGQHYLYNRKSGRHAWTSTRTQMLHCYGPAFALGRVPASIVDRPLSYGDFAPRATIEDVERDLVERLLARPLEIEN